MADDADDSQKTEDPSSRKLDRARAKGQVVQSREINTWFMLCAGAGIVLVMGPPIARDMERTLTGFILLRPLGQDGIDWSMIKSAVGQIVAAMIAPLALAVVAAVTGAVIQTGIVFATEKFSFDLSRLSPMSGFSRLFNFKAIVEFLKNLAKVVLIGSILVWLMMPELGRLESMITASVPALVSATYDELLKLILAVIAMVTVIAMADYVYQRFAFLRSMRMSKQEVKEEHRQSEGDPMVKGRLRQIRMERARRRMMAAVPKASVVVTNPTHFAVALAYESGDKGAPRVVAKGTDLVALRIREVAQEHGVPIVENPPLARALHAGVELDREIPPEHYRAVAEIIGYVFRLKGKMKGPATPAAAVVR